MALLTYLSQAGSKSLDFFFPSKCPVTGESVGAVNALSAEAWQSLRFIEQPFCTQCGLPFSYTVEEPALKCGICVADAPAYDKARARLAYGEAARAMLLRFKHGDHMQLMRHFDRFLGQTLTALSEDGAAFDMVAPVPLHPSRLRARKYNQAALLSKRAAEITDKPHYPSLLLRTKNTKQQQGLKPDRRKNVSKAFEVNSRYADALAGQSVLLLDDVFTTGSTVDSCAQALKKAGADKVYVVTLARVVKEA